MATTPEGFASVGPTFVLPGEVLAGKYKIERVLGAGGWGVVVAARNVQLGQRVAIKLLAHEETPDARSRMLREAQAAARILSDHVVQVFDVGCTESEAPYIVMEYLEGQDLASLLRRGGAVPVQLAVHWILQACEGLAAAQRHGIVHRDLKPANLFLERRPDGSVRLKLLDFGIAKLPDVTGLTQAGGFMGSPAYMAPEQLLDSRDVDGRTDVWSLGVVLYELLTARRPFAAEAPLALISKVRDQPHPPLASFSSEVPEELSRVVDRCLAKSREERWQGVGPLARALAPFAPPQCDSLIAAIERLGSGRDGQLTLGSDARAALGSATLSEAAPAASAESSSAPSGLAATLAGPHVLRSRLVLAGLVLAALALALTFGVLRRPRGDVRLDAPTPSSASPVASPPSLVPAPVAPAKPPQPQESRLPAPERPAPRTSTLEKRQRTPASTRTSAPSTRAAPAPAVVAPKPAPEAPPSGAGGVAPSDGPTSPSSETPAGGPLPIDRRGPWN